MTTSVTPGPPADQDPAGAALAETDVVEPTTASALSASPLAGTEQVQSTADAHIPLSAVGRIPVLAVGPVVDGGRFSAKAVVDEPVPITATVFREGHDAVAATAVLLGPDGLEHTRARMTLLAPGTDRYGATVVPAAEGRWTFRVEGWSDVYGTWEHAADIKVPAGLDVELMLEEGARVLERAQDVPGIGAGDVEILASAVRSLRDGGLDPQLRLEAGTSAAGPAPPPPPPPRGPG